MSIDCSLSKNLAFNIFVVREKGLSANQFYFIRVKTHGYLFHYQPSFPLGSVGAFAPLGNFLVLKRALPPVTYCLSFIFLFIPF